MDGVLVVYALRQVRWAWGTAPMEFGFSSLLIGFSSDWHIFLPSGANMVLANVACGTRYCAESKLQCHICVRIH